MHICLLEACIWAKILQMLYVYYNYGHLEALIIFCYVKLGVRCNYQNVPVFTFLFTFQILLERNVEKDNGYQCTVMCMRKCTWQFTCSICCFSSDDFALVPGMSGFLLYTTLPKSICNFFEEPLASNSVSKSHRKVKHHKICWSLIVHDKLTLRKLDLNPRCW